MFTRRIYRPPYWMRERVRSRIKSRPSADGEFCWPETSPAMYFHYSRFSKLLSKVAMQVSSDHCISFITRRIV